MSTDSSDVMAAIAQASGGVPLSGGTPAPAGDQGSAGGDQAGATDLTSSFEDMTPEQLLEAARTYQTQATTVAESEAKWKAQARKHEKDLKALRAKFPDGVQNGGQPTPTGDDASRQASAADLAETERLRQENLRLTVAVQKNIPAALVPRLVGDDLDEMLEDADRLIALIKPAAPPRPSGSADGGTGRSTAKLSPAQEFAKLING
jgi:hypothetical protein